MIQDDDLRRIARRLMDEGALPSAPPERVWGGAGTGARCAIRGRMLARNELEHAGRNEGDRVLHVHMRCHHV